MSLKAKDINDQTKWQDLTEGLKIFEPATSKQFETGEWRTQTPYIDFGKCKQCLPTNEELKNAMDTEKIMKEIKQTEERADA